MRRCLHLKLNDYMWYTHNADSIYKKYKYENSHLSGQSLLQTNYFLFGLLELRQHSILISFQMLITISLLSPCHLLNQEPFKGSIFN